MFMEFLGKFNGCFVWYDEAGFPSFSQALKASSFMVPVPSPLATRLLEV